MSNSNFESHSDGDWDDRGDLSWNEFDWQQFLKRHEEEIQRFIKLYDEHKGIPGHIDTVAHLMGWDAEDWAANPGGPEDESGTPADRAVEEDLKEEDIDPYTLHRHPVYVVIRGLFRTLRLQFEEFQRYSADGVHSDLVWRYAEALNQTEVNSILGVQALDMGDYALSVCQFKIALSEINETFRLSARMPGLSGPGGLHFQRESRQRLFDLRETFLRVMADCREEIRRSWSDPGESRD